MFFGLFLVSGISAFGQTTITFTDNGGASPFTIGGVAFTFAGATAPVWNATTGGYNLAASSANWIEFSLSDVGTIQALHPTGIADNGRITVKSSTDGGTVWATVNNGENAVPINKTGSILFRYMSTNTTLPTIGSITYTTINPATKFDLFLEQGNLYETNRTLNFTIRSIGDNLVNGTYSTGAEVAATYKITTGATEVVAPTPALMAKSVYSFNT
ncbi:MAG: hypothetical protein NT144_07860, partial [Bacteroidia bacterium]|nr:hypothetical protein [Bacteroidia bacterium]